MRILLDLRGLAILAYKGGVIEDTVMNAEGVPVPTAASGVKTFINQTLTAILEKHNPIDIIGVLEGANANARRRALYPRYKDKPSDDDKDEVQKEQKELCFLYIQKLLLALGCPLVKTPYSEADDTIAYLAQNLKTPTIIYTVDNDLTQLHGPKTVLMVKGEYKPFFKSMNFEEGVSPSMVVLYKSIVGDPSDCYVGVRGMGEAAWNKLVEAYGYDGMQDILKCVEEAEYSAILESLDSSPDKVLKKLYDSREEWRTSYLLAKLHPEWCETSFAGKSTRPVWSKRVPTQERLMKVLEPLGLEDMYPLFKKFMLKRIALDTDSTINWESMYNSMRGSPIVAFDYETYDVNKFPSLQEAKKGFVDVLSQKPTGASFAFGNNLQYVVYVPTKHRDTKNFPEDKLLEVVKAIDTTGQKAELVAHNATFEMLVTERNLDYKFKRLVYDTMIMASYVDEEEPKGLKHMSKRVLNFDQTSYNDLVKPGQDMRDVSLDEVLVYGCDDASVTAHIYVLYKIIMESEGTLDFYQDNEPYFDLEMMKSFVKGVNVNFEEMRIQAEEDSTESTKLYKRLRAVLQENCAEVNQDGFQTLWKEVCVYEEANLVQKSLDKGEEADRELIDAVLEVKRQETYDACKYNPLTPASVTKAKPLFSKISKHLGFPAIRSLKPEYISTFVRGFRSQAEEQEVEFDANQVQFLSLLESNHMELYDFCLTRLDEDEELWEGDELNITSPKQMAQLFYGKMNLPILLRNIDKNKVNPNRRTCWDMEQAPSTDILALESWLAELPTDSWKAEVVTLVKKLRAIKTRFSLYYKPYPKFKRPDTGRIHPGIKNCGTTTKRPSGTSPNFLQLSKKDEARFRRVVEPDSEDHVIVSIDFVQQELVVLAGLSNDPNLRSCYQGDNKKDVHSLTGRSIINLQMAKMNKALYSYEQFCSEAEDKSSLASRIRKKGAKTTNFLMVYGGSAAGLSRKATVPKEVADQWVSAFFETYPGVGKYQDDMVNFVQRHGFVKTVYGTRRHLTSAFSANKAIKAACERQGINAPIQGSCADLLKMVFREVVLSGLTNRLEANIIAPVYDEIIASVPKKNVYAWCNELADIMEVELPGLNMRLSTSVSIGPNAGDQVELGERPTEELILATLEKFE